MASCTVRWRGAAATAAARCLRSRRHASSASGGKNKLGTTMTLKRTFAATTALVLCVSASFARQETMPISANAQFVSWYGGLPTVPRDGSTLLYEQSASSGFSTYAVSDWFVWGSAPSCDGCYSAMAADDFILPGTGRYKITAVYAPGVILSGTEPSQIYVAFYDALKYSRKTGKTTIALKA